MRQFTNRLGRSILAAVAMMGFSAPLAVAEVPAALIEAAKAEGKLTVYTNIDPKLMQKLGDAFRQTHGVSVDVQRQASSALAQRFSAEADTGNDIADVYYSTDRAFHDLAYGKGLFTAISEVPSVEAWPAAARTEAGVVIGYNPYSIVWNKDLVPEGLTGWQDLVKPEYKGMLIMTDPRSSVTSNQFYKMLFDLYGEEYIKALGESATFSPSAVPGIQQVAAGAQAIYAPGIHQVVADLAANGAPLEEVFAEPSVSSDNMASVVSKAPHPNAARLFVAFLMTPEAQAINNFDGFSPIAGVPGTRDMPELMQIDPAAAVAEAEKIYALMGL